MISRYLRFCALITLCFLGLQFFSTTASAQVHPAKTWKTLSLEHFELIYDAENQQLAEVYALRLEALVPTLKSHWSVIPKKTIVVLNDRTDLTNGYATFLPYPLIMVFPVLPGPMDTIGEYNDWAWEILVHEYTHILEFEQRRGVVNGLSYVLGSIMTPNALLPRWWLEGAAVEAETRFSSAGRLRSKMQAGILRALAKTGELQNVHLSQINEFNIPSFPYGSRPYLYGSLIWSDWTFAKNEAATRDLHLLTGGRLPYMLDTPLAEVFDGKNQVMLFDETRTQMDRAAKKELAELEKVPFSEGKIVDPEMIESLSPSISPDALKLAYIGKNAILRRRVQVLVRPAKEVPFESSHRMEWFGREFEQSLPSGSPIPRLQDDAPPGGNITRVTWHPDSRSFVFDQVYEKNRFQELSDLWVFDLVTGKATKLTENERAREPSYSPDAKTIAFVRVQAGRTDLAAFDVAAKTSKIIYSTKPQERVSFPSWLDTNTLLFSLRENGHERLMKLNLVDSSVSRVFESLEDPLFVSVEKDRILVTATNNGVRNLYRAKLDFSGLAPVTHSASHILGASFDEGGKNYYYTEITEKGFQLKSLSETVAAPAELPKVSPFWAGRYADLKAPALISGEGAPTASDYGPWGYMWPRYVLPFVSWDDKGTYFTVQTSANDPLSKHAYALTGAYDSSIQRGSGIFRYVNQVYWPLLSLTAYDYSLPLASDRSYSRNVLVQAGAAWEIASISPDWFVGFGGMNIERSKFGHSSRRSAPFVTSSFRNAFQSAAQVTPETGWMSTATLSAPFDQDLAKTFYVGEVSGSLFWSKWLPARHALMLKAQGRYSDEPFQLQNMEQSVSQQTSSLTPFAEYLNRGYPSGSFLARNILSSSLEYRFPISRLDWGMDGYPLYIHRSHGAIVVDGTFFDGYVYDFRPEQLVYRGSDWGRGFFSVGAELKFDFNIGYALPFTTGIGLYWPLETSWIDPGPRLGISLIL